MVYKAVLTLLFRFINTGIVIGLMVYAFKKYIYPTIVRGYTEEKKQKDEQYTTLQLLDQAKQHEQIQITHDKEVYGTLKRKINIWQQACETIQERASKEHSLKQQQLQKQMNEQAYQIAQARLIKNIGPQIINNIKKSLIESASQQAKAHAMIDYILDYMMRARDGSN